MFRFSLRRPALILALAVFLLVPWEAAAGPRLGSTQRLDVFSGSTFSGFLSFFSKLWDKAGCLIGPQGRCLPSTIDNGCGIDPHGGCTPVQVDNGCSLDPSGGCAPVQVDNGCGLDPHGGCVPVRIENGCSLDPDGRCVRGD